jgi:hypothetical protein
LAALNESSRNGRTGRSGEFLELCAARIQVEGGGFVAWEVFLSRHDRSRGSGKSSGRRKLALAEFSRELDHDNHGKFLLSLRGTQFAG